MMSGSESINISSVHKIITTTKESKGKKIREAMTNIGKGKFSEDVEIKNKSQTAKRVKMMSV